MADLTTRLEHLQVNHDTLLERLTDTEDRLNLPIRDDATAQFIRRLEEKIREQDELIASQESQVEQDHEDNTKMRREVESLRDAASRTIQLEDELKELKFEALELAKKANTVDRFKQKLEVQKGLENEVKNLEFENEELRSILRDFNKVKQRNESLEATHLQFQNSIAKAEMEIFEIGSQKKMLDEEKAALQRSVTILEERRAHDEQFILNLQEEAMTKLSPIRGDTLADELQTTDNNTRQTNLEISRLKAENALLKGNTFAAQENSTLRAQLDEAEAYRKVIEAKYRDAFEKEAISQQQLRLMMNSVDDNTKFVELAMSIGRLVLLTPEYYRQQAFLDLKNAHIRITEQLSMLQAKHDALEADYEGAKRELLSATSDCESTTSPLLNFDADIFLVHMIEKDDVTQLEEFKATQESLSQSFENELAALKSKYNALEIDYNLQKSQLIESLLANNKLREALEQKPITEPTEKVEDSPSATPQLLDVSNLFLLNHSRKYNVSRRRQSSKTPIMVPQEITHASLRAHELTAEKAVFGIIPQTRTPPLCEPEDIALPASRPPTSHHECSKSAVQDIGRSLTDSFPGTRNSGEGSDDSGTSGMDSDRYSLSDVLVSEAIRVTTLENAAQEAAILGAARVKAAKDEAARIEAAEVESARFAAEQIEAAQRQAQFVEEAIRRKAERRGQHKSVFEKAISPFRGSSSGKK
jgi:hypothetical protein